MNRFELFFKLPLEMRLAIFAQLTLQELAQVRQISKKFNATAEDKSLWRPYLKPSVIEEVEQNNQSFSNSFGYHLEGLTEEGLQLHPDGPLYKALKNKIDACSNDIRKISLLRNESEENPDIARIILSNEYFRRFLLQNVIAALHAAFNIVLICDNRGMLLGFQWLFQPEVWKALAPIPSKKEMFVDCWLKGAIKFLDVAWLGFNNQRLMTLAEERYPDDVIHWINRLFSIVKAHKDNELTLFVLQTIMRKETLLNALINKSAQGFYMVKYLSDALQLTDRLHLRDPKTSTVIWNKAIIEDIFNQMKGLLEEALAQKNQENLMPRPVMH